MGEKRKRRQNVYSLHRHKKHRSVRRSPGCPKAENAVKELKGFEKVFLEPGVEKKVKVCLEEAAFARYDEEKGSFEAEEGAYILYAGSSLNDIHGNIHFSF